MVWILIRTITTAKLAENICSCWRSLCSCNSMLAHRVLMAGTVPPQRLPKHTFVAAASLQPDTSRWDISLTTSSMQRCEMSQFLLWFLFMIAVCGGAIIDTEGEKAQWPWHEPWLTILKNQGQKPQVKRNMIYFWLLLCFGFSQYVFIITVKSVDQTRGILLDEKPSQSHGCYCDTYSSCSSDVITAEAASPL